MSKQTRQVSVGGVLIGGGSPVKIQSMPSTKLSDIEKSAAQIAALADCHLLIQKNVSEGRAYTEIHPLEEPQRLQELARIISGDQITPAALEAAREMRQVRANL